jgi:hypothetical protein
MRTLEVAVLLSLVLPVRATAAGDEALHGLTDAGREQRQAAAAAVRTRRNETIETLISLAGKTVKTTSLPGRRATYPWHDSKHLAILLLGDLRAEQAVTVLLCNLAYYNPRHSIGGTELGLAEGPGFYPAVESLIKIGMPSVGPVTEKLRGYTEDCLERRLCVVVLKEVLGSDLAEAHLAMAIRKLEKRAAETPEEALRHARVPPDVKELQATIANLQGALTYLRKVMHDDAASGIGERP